MERLASDADLSTYVLSQLPAVAQQSQKLQPYRMMSFVRAEANFGRHSRPLSGRCHERVTTCGLLLFIRIAEVHLHRTYCSNNTQV
jgi:hypothetical protein